MVENQHRKIKGYADLSQETIDKINEVKGLEATIADLWLNFWDNEPEADKRWLNIAKTHFEEGCAAFVKAIAKGKSPFNR